VHFIHNLADVATEDIGDGTKIWQFVVVMKGAKIGSGCNICANCFIESEVVIGNDVTVKSGVFIWDGVEIGDEAFIGPCVAFTNDIRPRSKRHESPFLRTIVGKKASIGANATILPGVKIGEYAMIGAGSVVTKDVPSHALYYGNPARQHGYVCDCGSPILPGDTCQECGFHLVQ
jgi:UDP-2-acetamido-3-amino-2,3-dideoxy-glucuronate N-acetyltransferase